MVPFGLPYGVYAALPCEMNIYFRTGKIYIYIGIGRPYHLNMAWSPPPIVHHIEYTLTTPLSLLIMAPYQELYEEELYRLGFGLPIWIADPEYDRFEVQIGDVGYTSSVLLTLLIATAIYSS